MRGTTCRVCGNLSTGRGRVCRECYRTGALERQSAKDAGISQEALRKFLAKPRPSSQSEAA
jgi:uncharacterized OB-fold protein